MPFQHSSYRDYLRSLLSDRIGINPLYSLRTMAKELEIAPSTLSEVLKGKKNLSPSLALKVCARLELTPEQSEYFCLLAQRDSTSDVELKNALQERLQRYSPKQTTENLSLDVFKLIADWYHIPIRQMVFLKDFSFSAEAIAKRLGISTVQAQSAIDRLLRLELLEVDENGKYQKTSERWVAKAEVANLGLRRFHQQMLEKAIKSVETQTPKQKIIGSETMAFDPSQLPEVRKLADAFFDALIELANKGKKKTKVYHLGIQFFDLTDKEPT